MNNALRGIKSIQDFELEGKTVFLRLDLNVPIKNGVITDFNRITESLPTIRYALEKRARVILASHLGRPKNSLDKQYSVEPIGQYLAEQLKIEVILTEDTSIDFMKPTLMGLTKNQVVLFENLRFHEGETKNSEELAREWAQYTDIYINDAFGASHRAHASTDALPKLIKQKGCGFLIAKELEMLGQLLEAPKKPFLAILGGAKVSDKIQVIENLINRVDVVIIGGAMAYTFLKAQGHQIGKSLVEADQLNYARELIKRFEARDKSFLIPIDHRCSTSLMDTQVITTPLANIEEHLMGIDIGPQTQALFSRAIKEAGTIFWNGPMGVFETKEFSQGTFRIAQAIAQNTSAFRVIGGGDSASAAAEAGITNQVEHISTGGGASLEFLQGDLLPGLEVLRERKR